MKGDGAVCSIVRVFDRRLFAAVLVLCAVAIGFGYGGTADASGRVEQMLTPWDGFSSQAGQAAGVVTNPAALMDLDEYAVRVETARPLSDSQPDGMVYVYHEPDTGLGAGQLGYVALTDGADKIARFVYSGAKPAGRTAAVGFGLTHTQLNGGSSGDGLATWGLDVGFRGVLFERLAVGAVVRNAFLYGDEEVSMEMPPLLAAGASLDLGPVTLSGDYLLRGREAPFTEGYAYGIDVRLGRVLARYGERHFPEGLSRYTYYGLGYGFDMGRIDVTVGEREGGQTLVLGVSLFF